MQNSGKFINKAGSLPALTDEERLLISRAAELSARCDYSAVASCFLTPREQRILFESGAAAGGFFYGGALGATRRKLVFLPSWIEYERVIGGAFSTEKEQQFEDILSSYGCEDMMSEFYLPVHLHCSGYEKLSHRDWLGALMSLGIKRETIGDICFFEGEAYVFAEPKAAAYIESELKRAGRDKVCARICPLPEDFRIEMEYKSVSATVASPRIDGVVRALCNMSRDDAALLVTSGMVELNYFTETEVDSKVFGGDIISVRGHGKYMVDSADEQTKKGRVRIVARKLV
ncbi:MAG: hypothetical protein IKK26_00175 [Clostridia bacterium]|nr:hypothetical protein [Clostridia bacterium]